MAEPVLAKDAIIMFEKNEFWNTYQCARDVVINVETETKSIKTYGDGYWEKPAGQKLRYSIDVNGLIKIDDGSVPQAFDLLSHQINMVALPFQLLFTDSAGAMKVIKGMALPVNVSMGGGSDGFADCSFTLIGYGAFEILEALTGCNITIEDAEVFQEDGQNKFRVNNTLGGTVLRYEYSINGSGRYTIYSNEWILAFPYALEGSDYNATITVWAICENGSDGIAYQEAFTYGDPN